MMVGGLEPRMYVAALIYKPDPVSLLLVRRGEWQDWVCPNYLVSQLSFEEGLALGLKVDFGQIKYEIDKRVCLPFQFISREQNQHDIYLCFPIGLSKETPVITPAHPGVEIHWWPLDPCSCMPQAFILSKFTAEIISRVSEAK